MIPTYSQGDGVTSKAQSASIYHHYLEFFHEGLNGMTFHVWSRDYSRNLQISLFPLQCINTGI